MISRAVLRAHQLRSIGHGGRGPRSAERKRGVQRYLMEREWLSDGRVMQRVNPGQPDQENARREIGRWRDLATERDAVAEQGWEIDPE